MGRKRIQGLCLLLVLPLFAMSLYGCGEEGNRTASFKLEPLEFDEFDQQIKAQQDYSLVYEENGVGLYVHGGTAEIKVVHPTGAVWQSNPAQRAADSIAMGDSVERLNSQLYLTYYDIYDKSAE